MDVTTWVLVAALLGLVMGPLVLHRGLTSSRWQAALDGFTLVAVCGLASLHLLPEALAQGGLGAAGFAAIGLLVPRLLHRWVKHGPRNEAAILVGGIAAHAALETAALGAAQPEHVAELGAAIVFHRLPVGMLVFSATEEGLGFRQAWTAIGILVVATLVGFIGGEALLANFSVEQNAWLHGLVAGSLLHVAFGHKHHAHDHAHHAHNHEHHDHGHHDHGHHDHAHHDHGHHDHGHHDHRHSHSATPNSIAATAGGGIGLAVVLFAILAQDHAHSHEHVADTSKFLFIALKLALESAPALLLAYVLAGMVQVFITPTHARWLAGGSQAGQSLKGVLFGLPLPICSCGVLPVYESLVRRGVPTTAAMGFLVATPELGLDAILLSFPLLGVELTLARLVAAFLVALAVGWFVGRIIPKPAIPASRPSKEAPRASLSERMRAGARFGLVELFDHTMPWIVIGLLVAALAESVLATETIQALPSTLQVPLFALIGIPMYVCASGATPLAAVLVVTGVSPGAAIAFLLAGPATNLTTFGILRRLHGKRIALMFGAGVTGAAVALGWLVDAIALSGPVSLAAADQVHGGLFQWICLAALGLLLSGSVLRQGPRGVIEQITHPMKHGHHHSADAVVM